MPVTTLTLQDEVNAKFNNIDLSTRLKMVKEVQFPMPRARFMTIHAAGRWNGMISFCTKGGSTFINVLDRLIPIVESAGYQIRLDDRRTQFAATFEPIDANYLSEWKWPSGHRLAGQPITLEDHQVLSINTFLSNQQSVQEISTGAGKTILSAALGRLVEPHGRTLTVVPNKDLVTQTEADFKLIDRDVGVYFGDRKELGHHHTVCTYQSLNVVMGAAVKRDREAQQVLESLLDRLAVVIVDEVHIVRADLVKRLLCGPLSEVPIRWGMSGTIPKDAWEAMSLLCSLGPLTHQVTPRELQEKGFLAECDINVLQMLETVEHGNYAAELKYLTTDQDRLRALAAMIEEIAEAGNTLVLVDRIDAGDGLLRHLRDAVFIRGNVKSKVRKEHYDDINVSDNRIIVATYGVASVGINVPRLYNLVLLEPGKSFIRTIQSIGRSLRRARDKDKAIVWDITSTCKYSKKHLRERKRIYEDKEYPFRVKKIDYRDENAARGLIQQILKGRK